MPTELDTPGSGGTAYGAFSGSDGSAALGPAPVFADRTSRSLTSESECWLSTHCFAARDDCSLDGATGSGGIARLSVRWTRKGQAGAVQWRSARFAAKLQLNTGIKKTEIRRLRTVS